MKEKSIELLMKYTGHSHISLTARGNSAIYAALAYAHKLGKTTVLYPDQGGWFSYYKYPKKLGMEAKELKTDKGLIDLDDLKSKIHDGCCLIYSNPAGYYAHQENKDIYGICKGRCLVILDVTGCLSDKKLCSCADIMVGSFSDWKPVNLGYGGFISADFPIEADSFDDSWLDRLYQKLLELPARLEFLYKEASKVKRGLSAYNIIHKDRKGINVIVAGSDKEIIEYCNKNNYEYTICPRYIRVNIEAISIEIKRL